MPVDFGARDLNVLAGDAALASGDYRQAHMRYGAAAEMGLAAGQHNLAHLYQEGKGVAVDYAEAMKWYRKAAEQGAPISQVALGLMYYHGQGVAVDHAHAIKWIRLGAEQGFAQGEFILGQMYGNGTGVPRDDREAARWFGRAAQNGHPAALEAAKHARERADLFDEAEKAGSIIVSVRADRPLQSPSTTRSRGEAASNTGAGAARKPQPAAAAFVSTTGGSGPRAGGRVRRLYPYLILVILSVPTLICWLVAADEIGFWVNTRNLEVVTLSDFLAERNNSRWVKVEDPYLSEVVSWDTKYNGPTAGGVLFQILANPNPAGSSGTSAASHFFYFARGYATKSGWQPSVTGILYRGGRLYESPSPDLGLREELRFLGAAQWYEATLLIDESPPTGEDVAIWLIAPVILSGIIVWIGFRLFKRRRTKPHS